MNQKLGSVPFLEGSCDPINTMSTGPRYTSVPSGILIHPTIWPQQTWAKNWVGVGVPYFLGQAGSPSNTVTSAESYLHTKWHLSPSSHLATTDIGRKLGSCAPLGEGELGLHVTVSRRPRPTSVPSGILIHAAVWQQ